MADCDRLALRGRTTACGSTGSAAESGRARVDGSAAESGGASRNAPAAAANSAAAETVGHCPIHPDDFGRWVYRTLRGIGDWISGGNRPPRPRPKRDPQGLDPWTGTR